MKTRRSSRCPHCLVPTKVGEYCPACRGDFLLDGASWCGDYTSYGWSKIIQAYKYQYIKSLSLPLSEKIDQLIELISLQGQALRRDNLRVDRYVIAIAEIDDALFVPVPLHQRRLRWRGFNQAQELINDLVQSRGIRTDFDSLKRVRFTKPQAKLSLPQRQDNLKSSFVWSGPKLENKNIVLVDDIYTTGSTLDECAKILKASGAKTVWGLLLARG